MGVPKSVSQRRVLPRWEIASSARGSASGRQCSEAVSFLLTSDRNADDVVDFQPNQQPVVLLRIVSMRGLQCPRLLLKLLAAVVIQIGQSASRREGGAR